MIIGVPAETAPGERRVALVPETVARLRKLGIDVSVQSGAGVPAAFVDEAYRDAGATLAPDAESVYGAADMIVKVQKPSAAELASMREGQALLAFLSPLSDPQGVQGYASRKLTALSMDAIPRITRAQSMDALSSQANIGGYKAVILAADRLPRFFPMLTTAAGTIPPAKVLVLGAGVAGLQALATARRLGAVVTGYDTRAVVKEQVKSLGASFLELDLGVDAQGAGGYAVALTAEQEALQQRLLADAIAPLDVVITTAAIPGRRAPLLVTADAVSRMKAGSVVVDLAAEGGGNCELTQPGEVVIAHGVTIVGTTNLPSTMPYHASQLYSRNVFALLALLIKDGALNVDLTDEIVKGTTITKDGEILHPQTLAALAGSTA
ncbi:MAG: Re/Si-specific NAD(P)(+) transhydrogenase subunit alpha [Candidatus Eremiobacteraeota bacterium]|nr:Re/Si-specific NAD(P)(+) transhydrogenase subunit alpha [Candidatus Eremiobacteraeota bacterium]